MENKKKFTGSESAKSFDNLFDSRFDELLQDRYTKGLKKVYFTDHFYHECIQDFYQNAVETQEQDLLNAKIDSYIQKEAALAEKSGRKYFTDMFNIYKKNIKLVPTLSQEGCYIKAKTLQFKTKFIREKSDSTPAYLWDPYEEFTPTRSKTYASDGIDRRNKEVLKKEAKIGKITEKFFKEGKIERDWIPAVFKPVVFNTVVCLAFFLKAINKADDP